ncbi:ABC transporter permease [Candidatus Bipolaricaulota bacterium]|nr:ABC transporter permease [Candidatus Bipolaricaulota bacterium]
MVKNNKVALVGMILVLFVISTAVFTIVDKYMLNNKIISYFLYSPNKLDIMAQLEPPSLKHPLGTDQLGRDLLSRVIYGSRISIQVGFFAVGVSGIIGTIIGLIAGYYGGMVDDIIMRIVDILLAFPGLILAIAVAGFLGPSLMNVVFALSIRAWVNYARLIRGNVLSVKETDYISAAKVTGMGPLRLLSRHVLPNSVAPIIVQATMGLGSMIIAEAALSFLGLGPQPPTPSWGNLLSTGRSYVSTAWWLSIFPGIAIFITVMGFNLIGDAVRDFLDPKISGGLRQ